jgi:hypothetical protein
MMERGEKNSVFASHNNPWMFFSDDVSVPLQI